MSDLPIGQKPAGTLPGEFPPPLNWGGSFAYEQIEALDPRPRPLHLDIGCGQNKRGAEWVGVDTHEAADITAPMWAVPLPDACADAIYSSHALEHVMKAQVIPTLREWRRLLRPGGELTLRVPDLEWCVHNWVRTGMGNGWELDTIFGSQEHDGNCHRTGFTWPMLYFYLRRAGFEAVDRRMIESHGQPTIEVICR